MKKTIVPAAAIAGTIFLSGCVVGVLPAQAGAKQQGKFNIEKCKPSTIYESNTKKDGTMTITNNGPGSVDVTYMTTGANLIKVDPGNSATITLQNVSKVSLHARDNHANGEYVIEN